MNTETTYNQLQSDLKPYFRLLRQAAETILDQDISKYPIFVVHKFEELELGIPILKRAEPQIAWSVQVSTLEELVVKSLVEMEKVDDFRAVYKNPREFICLFVLMDGGANFVFLPLNI